jgi:hypothetical protein
VCQEIPSHFTSCMRTVDNGAPPLQSVCPALLLVRDPVGLLEPGAVRVARRALKWPGAAMRWGYPTRVPQ